MKYILVAVLAVVSIFGGYSYFTQQNGVGGGLGTIDQLGQWFFDGTYLTQNTTGRLLKLTGYESAGDCLRTDASGIVSTTACSGGSGSSKWQSAGGFLEPLVAYVNDTIRGKNFTATSTTQTNTFPLLTTTTATATTICLTGDTCRTTWPVGGAGTSTVYVSTTTVTTGQVAVITGPGTIGSVATGTISTDANFTVTANRSTIGGATAINLASGLTIPTTTGLQTLYASSHSPVTLAGAGSYLSIVGQVISQALINLGTQVTSFLGVLNGGTGTTTVPTTGQVLVGQPNGTYAPQATSTLGISGGAGTNYWETFINWLSPASSTFGVIASYFNATSTATSSTFAVLNKVVYADSFPGADIGAKVNAAYLSLPSAGGEVVITASSTFSTTMNFSVLNKHVLLRCNPDVVLNYSGTASATVFATFDYPDYPTNAGIDGCTFDGPGGSTAVGLSLGNSAGGAAGYKFRNYTVQDFGIGVYSGANTYLATHEGFTWQNNNQHLYQAPANNSGENMRYINGLLGDCKTIANCAYLATSSAASVLWQGNSLDNVQLTIAPSNFNVKIVGGHCENPAAQSAFIGKYACIVNSGETTSIDGLSIVNMATSSAQTPDAFIINTGYLTLNNVSVWSSNSISAPALVNNSGNAVLNVFGFNEIGTAVDIVATSSIGFFTGDNADVAIGTTTPAGMFDVYGNAFFGSTTGSATLTLRGGSSRTGTISQDGTSATSAIAINSNGSIDFRTDNISKAYITDTGLFGIGTLNPGTALQVVGTTTTSGLTIGSLTGLLLGTTGNTSAITTGSTGNVLSVVGGLPTWVATSTLGLGGGTGTVYLASSTGYTIGGVAFATGNGTISTIATGTISSDANFSVTAGRSAVGGALALSLASGLTIPTTTGLQNLYNNSHAAVTLAGTPDYITLSGQVITSALINLGTHITGILGFANGGTGTSTTPAQDQILVGNGTNYSYRRITAGANVTVSTSTAGQIVITAGAGGSTAWDAIGDPAGNGAVGMAETIQSLDWDTGAVTANAGDYFSLTSQNDATTDISTQRLFVLENKALSTNVMEVMQRITNSDAVAVVSGLLIDGVGAFTTAIDVSAPAIVTALSTGLNDLSGTNWSIAGATGALTLGTPLTATNGGTSQSTYATGDTLYASAANTLSKRTIGTTGDVLSVVGGVPSWVATSTLGLGGGTGTNFLSSSGANTFLNTGTNLQAPTFQATSTTGISTFAGSVGIGTTTNANSVLTTRAISSDANLNSYEAFNSAGTPIAALTNGGQFYNTLGFLTPFSGVGYAVTSGYATTSSILMDFFAANSQAVMRGYEGNGIGFRTGVTTPVERLRITQAGLVAIGTTTPTSMFQIQTATGTKPLSIASSSGGTLMSILPDGKVGIGTSTPSDALTLVVGNNAGLEVQSTNSGFLGYGKIGADKWRMQNEFTNVGLFEILYNNGAGGSASTSLVTLTGVGSGIAGRMGINNQAPAANLEIRGVAGQETTVPLLRVATSSVGTAQLFSVFATSTKLRHSSALSAFQDNGARAQVGISGYYGRTDTLDTLVVSGTIRQHGWVTANCPAIVGATAIVADGLAGCGEYSFYEDAADGTLTATAGSGYTYGRVTTGVVGLSGSGVFVNGASTGWLRLGTSTPSFEAQIRLSNIAAWGTTTSAYVGYTNTASAGTSFEVEPTGGCYFTASTTQANYLAVSANAGARTFTNTAIASTTVGGTGGGQWYMMRVDADADGCRFFMKESETAILRQVAYHTTNLPTAVDLNIGAHIGRGSSILNPSIDIMTLNAQWRVMLPLN